ncbi:sodium/proton antiporter shaA [Clostridium tetanomorphum]|nr:sodium/proton antiporter shaA [Clostridium tetanomorphum]
MLIDGKIVTYWLGNWMPQEQMAIGIGLEVDSFSLFVALIITFCALLSSFYSIKYMENDNSLDKYYTLFLMLLGSMVGFVLTGDLFNMYVMLEIMTFAAISLTAFRNDIYKSLEAAFKYIVVGSLGSTLILIGTILIYAQTATLNMAQIAAMLHNNHTPVTILALVFMLTGYGVKAFLVPCHTWPPDAHMSAPSSISMLLSGVMSKTGIYGFVRILFMIFFSIGVVKVEFLVIIWGTLTMIIGASMAIIQTDFKRLLAFSSVSQIGYIIVAFGIGLSSKSEVGVLGTLGGLYHMINHASFKCLLFMCAGAVLHMTGTTDITKLGGLSKKMPYTTILFLIGAFSISGIPPFNGFVSKWMIYQATYKEGYAIVTIISLIVSVFTLAYMMKLAQSVFFGELREELNEVKEIPLSMKIPMSIFAIICLIQGLFPKVISKYLLEPAAYSIYNIGNYIDVMFTKGFAESMFKSKVPIPNMTYEMAGYWRPEAWFLLFIVILIGFIIGTGISLTFRKKTSSKQMNISYDKYGVFTGGEKEEFTPIAGADLFWGLRHNLKGYFNFLQVAHSGIVNDYVIWIISCTAILTLYFFAVL